MICKQTITGVCSMICKQTIIGCRWYVAWYVNKQLQGGWYVACSICKQLQL